MTWQYRYWKIKHWHFNAYFWFSPNHKRSNSYFEQFFFLHWLNIYYITESSCRIGCSFFSPCKLSSYSDICKTKFKCYLPPPCEREVWYYKIANSECIQRAIAYFEWEKDFYNTDVNKKALLFNETVLNIIRSFIPHEAVIFDDRNLPWITSHIKKVINDKNLALKRFVKNKGSVNINNYLGKFNSLQKNFISLVESSK